MGEDETEAEGGGEAKEKWKDSKEKGTETTFQDKGGLLYL